MKVLVACEFTGTVRNAFLARGHDAYSCNIRPSTIEPVDRHIRDNVEDLLKQDGWDLIIAHPPCTYLCNSGVRWLKEDPTRTSDMFTGGMFFMSCLKANAPKVCVENPIMHGYAQRLVKVKHSQVIQPWQFGHYAKKATCLWLKNLPLLKPTKVLDKNLARQSCWLEGGKGRSARRAVTYTGIAQAMAEQWG